MYDLYNDDPVLFTLECASREFDIEMRELEFMQEMVAFKEQQDLKRAELKVFAEGGTDDDLLCLYEQVFLESEEPKLNIFQKIWQSICNMFKSVKEALFGSKSPVKQVKDDSKVEVPKGFWNVIKSAVGKIKSNIGNIIKAISVIAVISGLGLAAKNTMDKKKESNDDEGDGDSAKKEGETSGEDSGNDKDAAMKKLSAGDQALLKVGETALSTVNNALEEISNDKDKAEQIVIQGTEYMAVANDINGIIETVEKTNNESWVEQAKQNILIKGLVAGVQKAAGKMKELASKLIGFLNKDKGNNDSSDNSSENKETKENESGETKTNETKTSGGGSGDSSSGTGDQGSSGSNGSSSGSDTKENDTKESVAFESSLNDIMNLINSL